MRRLLFAALLAASGCRGDAPGSPPRVVLGRTPCTRCGMAISELRFAGGWVDESGESVAFDDAGELRAALLERPERASTAWAGDFESGRWVRWQDATLVSLPGLATPMGTGVIAFAERRAAERAAGSRRDGALLARAAAAP